MSVKSELKLSVTNYRGVEFLQPSAFSVIFFEARGLAIPCTNTVCIRMALWFISAGLPCHCLGTRYVCSEQSLRIALKVIGANKYLRLLLATMINNYVNTRLRDIQKETAKLDLPQIPIAV